MSRFFLNKIKFEAFLAPKVRDIKLQFFQKIAKDLLKTWPKTWNFVTLSFLLAGNTELEFRCLIALV